MFILYNRIHFFCFFKGKRYSCSIRGNTKFQLFCSKIRLFQSFHNSRLDELQLEKENLSLKINIVSGAIEQKCSVISEIVNDTLKNQSTISEYENVNILNESRTVYALSLYSKVSNISWDYASPSDHLCGCKYMNIYI